MKISYNWLKQYLPIDLPAEKMAEILTGIGLEVEGTEKTEAIPGGLQGLVTGLVLTAQKHPNADKLTLTTVDVGQPQPLQIVCGAPNVAAGQKVIVATVGAVLYPVGSEPFTIKKSKIRGETSEGMICAEDEIGTGTGHDGILVLPPQTPVGIPAKDALQLPEDYVFEIGLTPNRSDAGCHIGVAKDLTAVLKVNYSMEIAVQMPDVSGFKPDNNQLPINVVVENTQACPRYAGVSISGVTVKESPQWLQERLKSIGLRPINNVVDITNFVLHELGQPLHAFDADHIDQKTVRVKNLPQGTTFTTLDEVTRTLNADDLMICNGSNQGMCIAGVFGGIGSGVTAQTQNIFLESACFNPRFVRRTATRHNLRTDAATRFEKGVDPNLTVYALKRAALLIKELAGGTISSNITDIYPQPVAKLKVTLTYNHLKRLLGIDMPPKQVKNILNALEIDILEETPDALLLAVPTNKTDVHREADVIEEIIRIYGLNNIPFTNKIQSSVSYTQKPHSQALKNIVADLLAGIGFQEIMSASISNANYYTENDSKDLVKLLSSINVDYNVMRKTMLYSGLEVIARNQNRKNTDLRLFEFGHTYSVLQNEKNQPQYAEQEHLALFLCGNHTRESWRLQPRELNFFDAKEAIDKVLERLGIAALQQQIIAQPTNDCQYTLAYYHQNEPVAVIGPVTTQKQRQFDLKQPVYFANIYWNAILKLLSNQKLGFTEIPRFPSVRRDLALLLDKEITFAQVADVAVKNAGALLQSVNLFDIYEDQAKLGHNKKSYAIAFVLQDNTKTLTDKDIERVMNRIEAACRQQLHAELRQ